MRQEYNFGRRKVVLTNKDIVFSEKRFFRKESQEKFNLKDITKVDLVFQVPNPAPLIVSDYLFKKITKRTEDYIPLNFLNKKYFFSEKHGVEPLVTGSNVVLVPKTASALFYVKGKPAFFIPIKSHGGKQTIILEKIFEQLSKKIIHKSLITINWKEFSENQRKHSIYENITNAFFILLFLGTVFLIFFSSTVSFFFRPNESSYHFHIFNFLDVLNLLIGIFLSFVLAIFLWERLVPKNIKKFGTDNYKLTGSHRKNTSKSITKLTLFIFPVVFIIYLYIFLVGSTSFVEIQEEKIIFHSLVKPDIEISYSSINGYKFACMFHDGEYSYYFNLRYDENSIQLRKHTEGLEEEKLIQVLSKIDKSQLVNNEIDCTEGEKINLQSKIETLGLSNGS